MRGKCCKKYKKTKCFVTMGLNLIHNELLTKIFEESIVIIFLNEHV